MITRMGVVGFIFLLIGFVSVFAAQEPIIHARSIGTNTGILYDVGTASIVAGDTLLTLGHGAELPINIGRGDKLTLDPGRPDEEVVYVEARQNNNEILLQFEAAANHNNATFRLTRSFNSIQDWVNARRGDLVEENRVEIGIFYDDGPFTLGNDDHDSDDDFDSEDDLDIDDDDVGRIAKINGSITDKKHFMWLTVAENQRHKGVAGQGVLLDGEGTTKYGLQVMDDYTRIEWLQLKGFRGSNGASAIQVRKARHVLLDHLLIHDFFDLDSSVVGIKGSWRSSFTVRNCIIYDGDTAAIRSNRTSSEVAIENCTIVGMRDGQGVFEDAGKFRVKNTISMDNLKGDLKIVRGTQSHNFSSDQTASGEGAITGASTAAQFVSLDPGAEDFHLLPDADALGRGADILSPRSPVEPFTGLWTSADELADRPMEGDAWEAMLMAAQDADPSAANVFDQDSDNNVEILAAAIVFARTGDQSFRNKVVAALDSLVAEGDPVVTRGCVSGPIGEEERINTTLSWGRETGAYVLAADLVGYRTPAFETWLGNMADIFVACDNRTMRLAFETRPNNWGVMNFGSLVAIYAYLGNSSALMDIRDYFIQGLTAPNSEDDPDTVIGPGYRYGDDLSWHCDEGNLRLINPEQCVKFGVDLNGIIPDDQRRAVNSCPDCIPQGDSHISGWMNGAIMAARILDRVGLSIWDVGEQAFKRMITASVVTHPQLADDDGGFRCERNLNCKDWVMPILDEAYRLDPVITFGTRGTGASKNAGFGAFIAGD